MNHQNVSSRAGRQNELPVEICIDARDDSTVRATVAAAYSGGAQRIELCSAMHLDGLTPDPRHISIARDAFRDRPGLLVMVRPRAGDFCFSRDEVEQMMTRIELARQCGADGVVLGVLRPDDNRVAHEPMRRLLAAARNHGLAVTCHRAFDAAPDRDEALDTLIDLGVDRVLTSGVPWGQAGSAVDGLPQLLRTIERAAGRIEVVIGGGVNLRNVATLAAALPATARTSLHAYSGAQQGGVTTTEAVRALIDAIRQ